MSRSNLVLLAMLVLMVDNAAVAATFVVGNCKPFLPSYSAISAAVAAVPSGSTVQVCPGTYNEQVTITQPLTLQGIPVGDSSQAVIAPPSGGLATNGVMDDFGDSLAVQLYVNNVGSPGVNITNLTVDGTGNGVSTCTPLIVGVFYQNSFGTVKQLAVRNQNTNGCGTGIWAEGGSSTPTVTIANNSVHDQDDRAIYTETNSTPSELTATISANYVVDVGGNEGIFISGGSTATVAGNVVSGPSTGIVASGVAGSIMGNTVTNTTSIGIHAQSDGMSITSNKIINAAGNGIRLNSKVATIKSNTVENSPGFAIEFSCNADPNVNGNTINDVSRGLDSVPSGVFSSNLYLNVPTIKTGGC